MGRYERVEITFNKDNKIDMDLYRYLNNKSCIVGKAKYIKLLLKHQQDKEKDL